MDRMITRRHLLASASTAALALGVVRAKAAQSLDSLRGKRVTLLHFTDSHAQLETHLDYLPGATPQFQRMGGFARALKRRSNWKKRVAMARTSFLTVAMTSRGPACCLVEGSCDPRTTESDGA